jgi:hypothetical protein
VLLEIFLRFFYISLRIKLRGFVGIHQFGVFVSRVIVGRVIVGRVFVGVGVYIGILSV